MRAPERDANIYLTREGIGKNVTDPKSDSIEVENNYYNF